MTKYDLDITTKMMSLRSSLPLPLKTLLSSPMHLYNKNAAKSNKLRRLALWYLMANENLNKFVATLLYLAKTTINSNSQIYLVLIKFNEMNNFIVKLHGQILRPFPLPSKHAWNNHF